MSLRRHEQEAFHSSGTHLLGRSVHWRTRKDVRYALGHPVTPAIVRLLAAVRQVGTLYVKEWKVRIQPEQWAEVERLTGLGPQEFKETVHVARMGQYIGEANVTEAGMDLLAVQAQLNSKPAQEQP